MPAARSLLENFPNASHPDWRVTCARDFLGGVKLSITEWSAAWAKAGGAESKDPVEMTSDVNREVHGILRLRSGRLEGAAGHKARPTSRPPWRYSKRGLRARSDRGDHPIIRPSPVTREGRISFGGRTVIILSRVGDPLFAPAALKPCIYAPSRLIGEKCSGRDLNPHGLRHTPLKRTCLPIPPPERFRKGGSFSRRGQSRKCSFDVAGFSPRGMRHSPADLLGGTNAKRRAT